MKTENNVAGDLFLELEEAEKVDIKPEEEGTYSVTAAFGGFLSIICC